MSSQQQSHSVVPEMKERLAANRTGKLTPNQWLDLVLQPLTPILLLLLPAGFLLLPRLALMFFRGGWLVLLILIAILVLSFLMRARRYARAPIQFAVLRAGQGSVPLWRFWRPLQLQDEAGHTLSFPKRLAPRPILQREQQYLVYYLRDANDLVLLSIAPVDHPLAEKWQPDRMFHIRHEQRSRNSGA